MDGGGNFRANFGVERDGVNLLVGTRSSRTSAHLLAEGSYSQGADITTAIPSSTTLLKKLGWWDDELSARPEKAAQAEGKNWKTDLSGGIKRVAMKHGCHPFGNAKARAWSGTSPTPFRSTASRSTAAARPGRQVPDARRQEGVLAPADAFKTCSRQRRTRIAKKFPLIMTSGRLVEYEGGGEETRSNPWLAELQQEMFVEINPKDADDRGIRNGELRLGADARPARSAR